MADSNEQARTPLPPQRRLPFALAAALLLSASRVFLRNLFPATPHTIPLLYDRPVLLGITAFAIAVILIGATLPVRSRTPGGRLWHFMITTTFVGLYIYLDRIALATFWADVLEYSARALVIGGLSAILIFPFIEIFRRDPGDRASAA